MKRSVRGSQGPWRQRVSRRLTCGVVAVQMGFLLTLWVTPTWTPPRLKLIELLWAWMHRPTFYPFVVLLVFGPAASLLAACCPGRHRLWLLVSWLVFAVLLGRFHGERVAAMGRALWWVWVG